MYGCVIYGTVCDNFIIDNSAPTQWISAHSHLRRISQPVWRIPVFTWRNQLRTTTTYVHCV